jgi:thiol-disulfide isomerase/thioredoxin
VQKVYLTVIILLSMLNFAFVKEGASSASLKSPPKKAAPHGIFQEVLPLKLPMIPVIDIDGKEKLLEEYEGKYLIIHFWATWCLPCLQEMPKLDKFAKDFKHENLVVLPISIDYKGMENVKKFYEISKLKNVPALLDVKHKIYDQMNFYSVPATAIVDSKGYVIAVGQGTINWDDEELREELAFLIK